MLPLLWRVCWGDCRACWRGCRFRVRSRAALPRGWRGSCGGGAVFWAEPAAARRWFSSCRASHAARIRWLRTISRVVTNSVKGARPMRRHQPRLMSLVAGSLAGGEAAFGAGAAGVGPAVRGGGVVVFLRGLGCYLWRHGDGLLCAAGLGMPGRGEDLGPVPAEGHRGGAERAADLAHGGGAGDAVVAVCVVAGDAPELVTGEFGGVRVVRGDVAGVAPRESGPSSSSGRGVSGQYRLPLAMMAPSWVPLGPRSCGCRSWTREAPAARSGSAQAAASRWA